MSTEEQTVSQNQIEVTTSCTLKVVMNNGEEVYITLSEEPGPTFNTLKVFVEGDIPTSWEHSRSTNKQ